MIKFAFLTLLALSLLACGVSDNSTSYVPITSDELHISVTSEALLHNIEMFVQPNQGQMTPPLGRLFEDPANQTPLLTSVQVLQNTFPSTYSTANHTAILSVTAAQFSQLNTWIALVNANPSMYRIHLFLTYDDAGTTTSKVVTAYSFQLF